MNKTRVECDYSRFKELEKKEEELEKIKRAKENLCFAIESINNVTPPPHEFETSKVVVNKDEILNLLNISGFNGEIKLLNEKDYEELKRKERNGY